MVTNKQLFFCLHGVGVVEMRTLIGFYLRKLIRLKTIKMKSISWKSVLNTIKSKCGPTCIILLLLKILASIISLVILSRFPKFPVYVVDILGLPSTWYMSNVSCSSCNNFSSGILIEPQHIDCNDSKVGLVFLVMSSSEEQMQRMAIRESWGSVKEYDNTQVRTYFVIDNEGLNLNSLKVGANKINPKDQEVETKIVNSPLDISVNNNSVMDEIQKYNDILLLNVSNNYQLLTKKVLIGLKWATDKCRSAQYIMKTDVNTVNVPERLLQYLKSVYKEKFIGGSCISVDVPDRQNSSKRYISKDIYPGGFYPLHTTGQSYILSSKAAADVVSISGDVRYLSMEDVYVTGLCRAMTGIPCTNMPLLVPKNNENTTDCEVATRVGSIDNVMTREKMNQLWLTSRNQTFTDECLKKYRHLKSQDVFRDWSKLVIVVIVLAILAKPLFVILCCVCMNKVSCAERFYKSNGYKKVEMVEDDMVLDDVKSL